MSKFVKKFATVALALMVMGTVASPAQAALTQSQVDAIISLLQSFGADATTVANVNASLTGGTPVVTGTTTGGTSYSFTRDLTVGSRGDDVSALQQVLISGGYLTAVTAPTGYFGNATKTALAAWQTANGVTPAAGYFGAITRAKLASLGGGTTGTTGGGTTQSGPLSVSFAFDNPGAGNVPKGAAGMTFLKFVVSGNGILDSLVVKRVGIGSVNDFSSAGVYLYEGGTRLTSGKSINSTTHEVSFPSLNLSISGSRTFSVVADVAAGATSGNIDAFAITSVNGNAVTLTGNNMGIAGQLVGGIDATTTTAPVNPKVGQSGAKLTEFKLTASSTEDVMIQRVALTEAGSISNDKLTNFVLKQGGNTIATAASIGGKDLIVFTFTTPFKIEKGQERTFEVFGDVAGTARTSDTIILYFDTKSDIYAIGGTYGYPVIPGIGGMDATTDVATLTLAGGPVTITFNGPIAGDISLRGQDVTLFDFNIAAQNNIEIRNLRFYASTTGLTSGDAFNDFKVWNVDSNAVVTSAQDVTASTSIVFTDTLTILAGQTKHYKVTVDVDSDNDEGDSIQVILSAFQTGDIKNLDNNTNVTIATDVVPSTALTGNFHTVKAPNLAAGLSGSPSSQTYVSGAMDKPLVGFSFKATGGNVRLDTVRVTGAASVGTLGAGEVTNLALYDEAGTRVSEIKSLDTSALTATFTGLNLTINSGATKLLTLKGNVDVSANTDDAYYFYLASGGSADLTAYDADGNAVSYTGGVAANNGPSVVVTIASVGAVTVATAPSDAESKAGIILANGAEQVLGKFDFTATNENMTVRKLAIMVNASSNSAVTSTATGDEVSFIKLYDGATQVGSTYYPDTQGASSSIVQISDLGWVIPKDSTKTLTVKGVVNTIGAGADTGAQVFTHILATGFQADGSSSQDTTITAASGNQKVVYKTKPTLSLGSSQPNTGNNSLTAGSPIQSLRFRVAADANGNLAWRQVQFEVAMTGATMSAASPTNMALVRVSDSQTLALATVYSGAVGAGTTATITGGNTAYVGFVLAGTSTEQIAAGSYQDYDLKLTFTDISATDNAANATVKLYKQETSLVNATWYAGVAGAEPDSNMNPSFIWTDRSVVGNLATTTADWANGVYVNPSLFTDISNQLQN